MGLIQDEFIKNGKKGVRQIPWKNQTLINPDFFVASAKRAEWPEDQVAIYF